MSDVIFEDFTLRVIDALDDSINRGLEESAAAIERAAADNTRVDTGKTKGSWKHHVDESIHEATIGNTEENAIWEEFGTGEHALKGNGRQGGWVYQDAEGEWHYTTGKKPSRAFHKAYTNKKNKVIQHIRDSVQGGL